ncbi:MAG TPA: chorismate-binding protein, partial [Phycisphaerales bacterium]|nr:chorismate-binding protein [Phycisphaerales bacterium]
MAVLWSGGSGEHARWTVLARASAVRVLEPAADPAAWARSLQPASAAHRDAIAPGWMVCLGYELGGVLEPVARGAEANRWPLAVAVRCDDAWVRDNHRGVWHSVGSPPALEATPPRAWRAGPLASAMGESGYAARAARAVEYIRAGDVYQVNLAHELSGPFHGSARGLFRDWVERSGAWYGAYLEWDAVERRRAVLSASPELFMAFDPASRRLVTRP